MTHVDIIGFKQDAIILAIAHTWAFGTLCYKATAFAFHNKT
jgi:hypothetical protein